MIKASGRRSSDGAPLLILGLSKENTTRLLAGQPILIRTDDMLQLGLPPIEVVLLGGATEQTILAELRAGGWVTDTTRDETQPATTEPPLQTDTNPGTGRQPRETQRQNGDNR